MIEHHTTDTGELAPHPNMTSTEGKGWDSTLIFISFVLLGAAAVLVQVVF